MVVFLDKWQFLIYLQVNIKFRHPQRPPKESGPLDYYRKIFQARNLGWKKNRKNTVWSVDYVVDPVSTCYVVCQPVVDQVDIQWRKIGTEYSQQITDSSSVVSRPSTKENRIWVPKFLCLDLFHFNLIKIMEKYILTFKASTKSSFKSRITCNF